MTGWLLVPGRHTISRAIQAAHGPGGGKHHATLYRFLARGRWQADELGRTLLRLLLVWLPDEITVLVDDTLCHKSGPHLFGAGMHHDASRSTYGRGRKRIKGFAFGHQWVVLAVRLACPWDAGRGWAVPIAFRLYRPARRCARAEYRKRTDLAAELVTLVASWLPADRRLRVVGDAEYACRTLVRALPPHSRLVGPLPMDAALFKRPGRPHRPGRPRRKGQRLPNPARLVASKRRGWQRVSLRLYGHPVTLRIWTRVCLWYHVAGSTPVRVVVTQDPKGRARPRAYLCTDPDCPAHEVLESYAQRWELEVALRNAKQSLGVEDPQNGWWRRKHGRRSDSRAPGPRPRGRRGEQAVRHTVPLAFVAYALVLVWYLGQGDPQREVRRTRRIAPWYRHKQHPSYADMLAALRQALWRERLSPNPPGQSDPQKLVELLPLWLLAA